MGYINDIIQTHLEQAACSHDAGTLFYCIKGTGDVMYHCKFVDNCNFKKTEGILTYCLYFDELSKKIKTYQETK